MSMIAPLKKYAQEQLAGRLWAARYAIKHVEENYNNLSIYIRRDIHLHGSKARFLLAGALQHLPAKNKFQKKEIPTLDTKAGGPSELCPVIDMFDDVRVAQEACDDWLKHPGRYTVTQIDGLVSKAEKVASTIQILYDATKRGGDETPPQDQLGETISEFALRLRTHANMVRDMSSGYEGEWAQVPAGYVQLCEQQVVSNWNGVCRKVIENGMSPDDAIAEMREKTSGMTAQEWAWEGQVREWFKYEPELGF